MYHLGSSSERLFRFSGLSEANGASYFTFLISLSEESSLVQFLHLFGHMPFFFFFFFGCTKIDPELETISPKNLGKS